MRIKRLLNVVNKIKMVNVMKLIMFFIFVNECNSFFLLLVVDLEMFFVYGIVVVVGFKCGVIKVYEV